MIKHKKRKALGLAAALGVTASLLGSTAPAGAIVTNPTMEWVSGGTSAMGGVEGYTVDYSVAPTQQWTATTTTQVLQGDFNGDHADDFYMYGPGAGLDQLWLANNYAEDPGSSTTNRFTTSNLPVSGTYKPFVGDFDGNGADDIFWYAPGTAPDSIWYFQLGGSVLASVAVTVNGTYQPTVANLDTNDAGAAGIGTDDIFWYGSTGAESMWSGLSNRTFSQRVYSTNVGPNAQVLVGNFKSDSGTSLYGSYWPDIFFYVPGTGQDSLWTNNGTGSFTATDMTVNGTYQPIVGNFNTGKPGWVGGLSDIIWYAPGTKTDTIWMNGNGAFGTGQPLTINGTYKPFVVPGFAGPDMIVWNNPSGGDSVWMPNGSQGTWSYTSRAWQGADMGSRTPYVGYFDDAWEAQDFDASLAWSGGSTGFCPCTFATKELRRNDIFWFSLGDDTGQDERIWRLDGADVTIATGTQFAA